MTRFHLLACLAVCGLGGFGFAAAEDDVPVQSSHNTLESTSTELSNQASEALTRLDCGNDRIFGVGADGNAGLLSGGDFLRPDPSIDMWFHGDGFVVPSPTIEWPLSSGVDLRLRPTIRRRHTEFTTEYFEPITFHSRAGKTVTLVRGMTSTQVIERLEPLSHGQWGLADLVHFSKQQSHVDFDDHNFARHGWRTPYFSFVTPSNGFIVTSELFPQQLFQLEFADSGLVRATAL